MKKIYSNTLILQAVLVSSVLIIPKCNAHAVESHLGYFDIHQEILTVSGKVTDENTKVLAGVTILVDSRVIAHTDSKGNYKVSIKRGSSLTFKLMGFKEKSVLVNTDKLNVTLFSTDAEIDEVVVTALGIKREERALGYSATTVKGEELTNAMSNNWMDALSGKVAGLNLMRSNAGPVGGTKIILRGEKNLTGDNEALIVVDGIVINSGSGKRSSNDTDAVYGTGSDNMPADYGSGMDDLNPEDIESITVLKGARSIRTLRRKRS